ncbi:MAG: helix-turn-helix domain-containing protein [Polyangiaceae bacterium]
MSERNEPALDPRDLDVGTLALFVGQAFVDEVRRRVEAKGLSGLRVSHGYVIQHLVTSPRTISELATRMGVTQQAASKSVAELEALGYVERRVAPEDARVRTVALSARGEEAVRAARAARSALERELARRHGDDAIRRARRLLADLLTDLGGVPSVRARRVRPPR